MNILDILFPKRCVSCGKIGSYFCRECISEIDYIKRPICPVCAKLSINGSTHPKCLTSWSIDGMYALSHFSGPVKKAIHLLKYKLVTDVALSLVDIFLENYPKELLRFDLLVPVPLYSKKEKHRGFNQSLVLAILLSQETEISLKDNILKRIVDKTPQAKLKGDERRKNIRGVFEIDKSKDISGKRIGLVDDVATTRSTLMECAKLLKRKGAKSVWGLVLAHG